MEKRELVCIVCPKGCRLEIDLENGDFRVSGNECVRGERYGVKELTHPTRVLTSTVKLEGSDIDRLPIVSKGEIPKDKLFEAMEVIHAVVVRAPIKMGCIIVENLLDTGVDIVAARTIEPIDKSDEIGYDKRN